MKKKLMGIVLTLVVFLGLSSSVSAVYINFRDENGTKIGYMEHVTTERDIDIQDSNATDGIDPNNLTKDGYTFIGWSHNYTDGLLVIDNDANKISYGRANDGNPRDVYATWSQLFTITYDLDGGIDPGNPTSYIVEETVEITDPTKEGYEFLGWLNEQGENLGKNLVYAAGSTDGDKFLTAAWKKNPEATTTTTSTTNNPKTGINATTDSVLLILGLASLISLVVLNPKKSN